MAAHPAFVNFKYQATLFDVVFVAYLINAMGVCAVCAEVNIAHPRMFD